MTGHEAAAESEQSAQADRTIEVTMTDGMRFSPNHIEVKAGQTVRFIVKNVGDQPHEMVIGSLDELKAHAEQMRQQPGMAHDEPNMVRLDAGETGEIVWHFDSPGQVDFACLIPGHLEAGMQGTIDVRATP
ncbi:cupredoxin domain-containing protein [Guyparkeria halopsychrophila]|uniref:cupredoxin domain-containing protein n=1 Tax=Guyparkeria halopsychrophila TaxID=3139421 RepID=UPI0037CC8CA5